MGSAAGAEPLSPSRPAWFPAFMVSPAQARPETFPNSLESHNGEGSREAPGRGVGMRWTRGGPQERGKERTAGLTHVGFPSVPLRRLCRHGAV